MMDSTSPVTIRVAPTHAGIEEVRTAFEAFRTACAVSDADTWPTLVALDEVLSNVFTHACAGREAGAIEVSFAMAGDALTVAVADDAPPALMDGVNYSRQGGRNCVVVTRRVSSAASRQED